MRKRLFSPINLRSDASSAARWLGGLGPPRGLCHLSSLEGSRRRWAGGDGPKGQPGPGGLPKCSAPRSPWPARPAAIPAPRHPPSETGRLSGCGHSFTPLGSSAAGSSVRPLPWPRGRWELSRPSGRPSLGTALRAEPRSRAVSGGPQGLCSAARGCQRAACPLSRISPGDHWHPEMGSECEEMLCVQGWVMKRKD